MNEAFLFLNWLKKTNSAKQLLAEGNRWQDWAREQGFNPIEILSGLSGTDRFCDQRQIFLRKLLNQEWDDSSIVEWIDSLLFSFFSSDATNISQLAGGTSSKEAPHSKLQQGLNHIAAKDFYIQKEVAESIYREIPSDEKSQGWWQGYSHDYVINTRNLEINVSYGSYNTPMVHVYNKNTRNYSFAEAWRNPESKRFQGDSWEMEGQFGWDYTSGYAGDFIKQEYKYNNRWYHSYTQALVHSTFVSETLANINATFANEFNRVSADVKPFLVRAKALTVECNNFLEKNSYINIDSFPAFLSYKASGTATAIIQKWMMYPNIKNQPVLPTRLKAEFLIDSLLIRQSILDFKPTMNRIISNQVAIHKRRAHEEKILLIKLSHPRITSKINQTNQEINNTLNKPKEIFLDNTNHEADNKYTYTGNNVSFQVTFTDYAGGTIEGHGSYTTTNHDWYHPITYVRWGNGEIHEIAIGNKVLYPSSIVNRTDNSLLQQAIKLQNLIKKSLSAYRNDWTLQLNAYTRGKIRSTKYARFYDQPSPARDVNTIKNVYSLLSKKDIYGLSTRHKNEIFLLDYEARKKIRDNLHPELEKKIFNAYKYAKLINNDISRLINDIVFLQDAYSHRLKIHQDVVNTKTEIDKSLNTYRDKWSHALNAYSRNELNHLIKRFKRHHRREISTYKRDLSKTKNLSKQQVIDALKKIYIRQTRDMLPPISSILKITKEALERPIKRLNTTLSDIVTLQNQYKRDQDVLNANPYIETRHSYEYKYDWYTHQSGNGLINQYIETFGRHPYSGNAGGKNYHLVPVWSYKNTPDANSKAAQKNQYYASNYEKYRVNLAVKAEELFAKSELTAINAASATFQQSRKEGLPEELCLDQATSTYLNTIAKEDINFYRSFVDKQKDAYTTFKGYSGSRHDIAKDRQQFLKEHPVYQLLAAQFLQVGVSTGASLGQGAVRDVALEDHRIIDVAASVSADILQRQVDVAKDVIRDDQSRNAAIALFRIKLLVKRITLEQSAAQRYELWYAKHPQQYVQHHFFKHLGGDIWKTITMPERAIKSEIKGWKSGAGFWGGLKDGLDTEGKILHKDIKGINHLIRPIEDLFEDCFNWIPWVGKAIDDIIDVGNLIGKGLENLPFHLVKNGLSLGKQLYRVVTLQATWKGIWDGIGRDTHSVRHLAHMAVWLLYESSHFHYKKIYDTIGKKAKSADRAVKLYIGRDEIKKAIVIKHDELLARRKIHHHFHHLVKSPMRILIGDAEKNLKNDKVFSGFRENFLGSRYGKAYLEASALNPSIITNTKVQATDKLRQLRNLVHEDINTIEHDLLKQAKDLTFKQKQILYKDYKNNEIPWRKIVVYDLNNTTVGIAMKGTPEKVLHDLRYGFQKLDNLDNLLHNVLHNSLASFQLYLKNRQKQMSKRAEKWSLHGHLLSWAQGVDKRFLHSVEKVEKDLQTSKGKVFEQKAFKDYIIYKDLPTIRQAAKQEKTNLIQSTVGRFFAGIKSQVNESKSELKSAKHQYDLESKRITHEWNQWGKKDGKMALTAYESTFRPHFTINYGPPLTVTSSTLTAKEAKVVTTNITSKNLGKRFFVRAMWTEYLKSTISNRSFVSLHNKFSRVSKVYSAVLGRFSTLDQRAKAEKSEIKAKLSTFMSSHILLRDLIIYDSGTKAKELRRSIRKKEKELNNLIYNINNMKEVVSKDISVVRERAPKAIKKEFDFMQLMNTQVSVFNKSNFKKFEDLNGNSQIYKTHQSALEAHGITPVKLLCVQSALAYDFDPQVTTTTNNKGNTTTTISDSRFQDFKKRQKKTELGSDYVTDRTEEKDGDNLTTGQVLYSAQTTQQANIENASSGSNQPKSQSSTDSRTSGGSSSRQAFSAITEDWKTFITNRQVKTSGSRSTDEDRDGSSDADTHSSAFWFKLPHNSSGSRDSTTKKTKSNLLQLYRQYKMIKHITHKAEKDGAKAEKDGAKTGEESDGLDFDSLISGETGIETKALNFDSLVSEDSGATTRSLNRKALRLDDDALDKATRSINREAIKLDDTIDFVDNEVATDEKIAENTIQQDTVSIEQDAVNKAEQDLIDKTEDIDPSSGTLQPLDEIGEFRNAVIDTASDDLSTMTDEVSTAADSDLEAAETDISTEVEGAEVEAELALDEAAEAALL